MKDYFFITLQIAGLILFYGAVCIIFAWIFKFYLPLPPTLNKSLLYAKIVLIVLPIIGVLSIKFGGRKIYLIIGYIYFFTWAIVILRIIVNLFTK